MTIKLLYDKILVTKDKKEQWSLFYNNYVQAMEYECFSTSQAGVILSTANDIQGVSNSAIGLMRTIKHLIGCYKDLLGK